MNQPDDDPQQSNSCGSNDNAEYLHRGLAKVATPKPGEPTVPFSFADGVVTAGKHRVTVAPFLERTDPVHGKIAAGLRFDVTVDGSPVLRLTHRVLSIDESAEKACEQAAGDWYLAFGLCMFSALAEADPTTKLSGWNVHAGSMGFRGSKPQDWLDGSPKMHDMILETIFAHLPAKDGQFHSLSLMVASDPNGTVKTKCEVDAKDAPQAAAALRALPWPNSGPSYMFKQSYVFR